MLPNSLKPQGLSLHLPVFCSRIARLKKHGLVSKRPLFVYYVYSDNYFNREPSTLFTGKFSCFKEINLVLQTC